MDFGRILSNKEKWTEATARLKASGIFVPPFLLKAINSGFFDVFSKDWTNFNSKNLKFRGDRFSSLGELEAKKYFNSPSIRNNIVDVYKEIVRLRTRKAIRQVSHEEALSPETTFSPILWVSKTKPDGSIKSRLVFHSKYNCLYSKPKLSMPDIAEECHIVSDFEEIIKVDMEDCYGGGAVSLFDAGG